MAKLNPFSADKKTQQQTSILNRFDKLPPTNNTPTFKFENPGDRIYARFIGRRFNVQTKKTAEPSTLLDVEILNSLIDGEDGPSGKFGIFESSGISQIMDSEALNPGDVFYLRFDSLDKRFKRFAFKKLSEQEAVELEKELDDVLM